jgi:branched-chain amino acid transport system substrate-binding protein
MRSYLAKDPHRNNEPVTWKQTDFLEILWELKDQYQFHSVFVAGDVYGVGELIKQARMLGITVPILAVGEGVDTHRLRDIAGDATRGVIVASLLNPEDEQTIQFIKRFRAKYGAHPDTSAAQGYDAVSVLASAIRKSGSTVPEDISNTLRFFTHVDGVVGTYSFTPQGNITGKKLYFKSASDGKAMRMGEGHRPEKSSEGGGSKE